MELVSDLPATATNIHEKLDVLRFLHADREMCVGDRDAAAAGRIIDSLIRDVSVVELSSCVPPPKH